MGFIKMLIGLPLLVVILVFAFEMCIRDRPSNVNGISSSLFKI